MKFYETNLKGVKYIKYESFEDNRGYFFQSFLDNEYSFLGDDINFKQDNFSLSKKNVLRGLHAQNRYPQGKLVTCTYGKIFDVAIDIDINSHTYGEYFAIELSQENNTQLWIPPGYAHGFCVLSETAIVHYKCSEIYHPEDELGFRWNDPFINIKWPISNPIVSTKDLSWSFI